MADPYDADQLPLELWSAILEHSSRAAQRTCLLVCRALHDLALPLVFARVVIRAYDSSSSIAQLVAQPSRGGGLVPPFPTPADHYVRAKVEAAVERAAEFLQCIIRTPTLAGAVRSLTLQWSNEGGTGTTVSAGPPPADHSEMCYNRIEELVRRSIMVMPNLHEFRWAYDAGEMGPARLTDAFVRTLLTRTTLKKLTIPLFGTAPARESVCQFKGLASLCLPYCFFEHPDEGFDPDMNDGGGADVYRPLIDRSVTANAATLETLLVVGYAPWACTLPMVKDLSLILVLDLPEDTFRALDRDSPNLTHLTLTGYEELTPILSLFEASPDAFPRLESFKFLYDPSNETSAPEHRSRAVRAVSRFIQNKTRLRRLYVSCLGHVGGALEYNQPILELLPRLPRLQVLGLELDGHALRRRHLACVDEHLPNNLTDLLLLIDFPKIRVTDEALARMFITRRSLKTLHIIDLGVHPDEGLRSPIDPLCTVPRVPCWRIRPRLCSSLRMAVWCGRSACAAVGRGSILCGMRRRFPSGRQRRAYSQSTSTTTSTTGCGCVSMTNRTS
ncbi:hypothetical protein C8Q74DRAFT_1018384 [Fomes fomentarius]|nr:hypothetical protein C8Q74DRAFT_1018384 [Fomes fomentarius]